MAERVNVNLEGVEDATRRLGLLPREVEKVMRKTDSALGDRSRRATRNSLRDAGVSKAGQRKRVQGRGGRVWVGADDINPVHLQGRVTVENGVVYVDGAKVPGGRLVKTRNGGYIVRYDKGQVVGAVIVDFQDAAFDALDAAEAVGESDLYAQIFENLATREITGITKRL